MSANALICATSDPVDVRRLIDPVSITHQGYTLVLARLSGEVMTKVYLNVRAANADVDHDLQTFSGWQEVSLWQSGNHPSPSGIPQTLRIAGLSLVSAPPSVTTPTPADAPFRAISDGKYISILRPSTSGSLYLNRFLLLPVTGDDTDADEGVAAPASYTLSPVWEVRYERSGLRDTPAGPRDALGYRDVDGIPFVEPTLEIVTLPSVAAGNFAVVTTPSVDDGTTRWNFVTTGSAGITVTSLPQLESGLLDFNAASRRSFTIAPLLALTGANVPLTLTGPVDAVMFGEQEPLDPSSPEQGTLKRIARVMLAAPVSAAGSGLPNGLAVFDLPLASNGTPMPPPPQTASPLLDGSISGGVFTPLTAATYPVTAAELSLAGDAPAYAYVLGQVLPSAPPRLLASGDGRIHCYYAGPTSQQTNFLVAQYSPLATRVSMGLTWQAGAQSGSVALVGRQTGSILAGLAVSVTSATDADLCNVTINYGAGSGLPTETWTGVPRRLDAFVATLNGSAAAVPEDQRVLAGAQEYFDYAGTSAIARLPLSSVAAPTGHLTLVSQRTDVALATVAATAAASAAMLVLSFTVGGRTVTQTWTNLPLDAARAAVILRGDASSGTSYTPSSDDTAVLGLRSANGTMLFFLPSGVNASTVNVAIAPPTGGIEGQIDVVVTVSGTATRLTNVKATVADVAAAMAANPTIAAAVGSISPGTPGTLVPGASSGVLDLRALSGLFAVLPPLSDAPLVTTTVTAGKIMSHGPQPLPNRAVGVVAAAMSQPANGVEGLVQNGTAVQLVAPTNGAWVAATPGDAMVLTGQGAMSVPTATAAFALLKPGLTTTVEAWVKPQSGAGSQIVCFNGPPLPAGDVRVQPTYSIGTVGAPCMNFALFSGSGGQVGSSISVTPQASLPNFPPNGQFTWEAWAKPASTVAPSGYNGAIVQFFDTTNPTASPFEFGFNQSLHPIVTYYDGAQRQSIAAPWAVTPNQWVHLAVTGRKVGTNQCALTIVVGDQEVVSQTITFAWWTTPPAVYIGGAMAYFGDPTMAGAIADVRAWSVARTLPEIRSTVGVSLSGYEPALVGLWMMHEVPSNGAVISNSCAATNTALNGVLALASTQQAVTQVADGTFLSVTIGMGGASPQLAAAFLLADRWNHVAVVNRAGTGLSFDPSRPDRALCGNGADFDVGSTFSVDAWVQIPIFNSTINTIASKWSGAPEGQSWWLGIDANGHLSAKVQVEVVDNDTPTLISLSSSVSVVDQAAHHVALTFATTADSENKTFTVDMVLYQDGKAVATTSAVTTYPGLTAVVQRTTTPVALGASATETTVLDDNEYLQGVLAGVRIWSVELSAKQVLKAMKEQQGLSNTGMIAAWWFNEMSGKVAADSVSNNNAQLSSAAMWTQFARLSSLACVANGRPVGAMTPWTGALPGYPNGTQQFTAGAAFNGTTLGAGLVGGLTELRIWRRDRTLVEIGATMYQPLVGDEDDLVAYWNFDNGQMTDATGNANNGQAAGPQPPTFAVSDAPVSDEGPWVRNAYGGVLTTFQSALTGPAAVVEFGQVQRDAEGAVTASLQRGYAYAAGALTLSMGFRVGELALTYLGQVQTKPTLLGYIEGAPPVPSENLSRPFYNSTAAPFFNYFGASSVTLTETETTAFQFTSTRTVTTVPFDMTTSIGPGWMFKVAANAVVVSTTVVAADGAVVAKYKGSIGLGDTASAVRGSGWTDTITDSLSLRGDWEPAQTDPANYLNPTIGRRFVPANQGYALVVSNTADLFAMQMRSTGAMLGSVAVPNLDIPPDRNIITFQIDPHYVSNGTLDGKVGLVDDPAYQGADFERRSYFNPREAALLKAKIERQNAELTAYYDQLKVGSGDVTGAVGKDSVSSLAESAEGKMFVDRTGDAVLRKSLVNTYVWTAAGGLHTEAEQVTDSRQLVYSGFRKDSHMAGLSFSGKWMLGPGVAVGPVASFDYMAGQQIDITLTKSRTDASGFGLGVQLAGDPILLGWNQQQNNFSAAPCPGKVTAYRFNAFYLAPDSANADEFNKRVVDQNWLRSDDPNAVALREATISGQSVWRVLYRVTYVSRVPPEYDTAPDQTVAVEYNRTIDPFDDAVVIAMIVAQLGHQVPTPQNIGTAIAAVMAPEPNNGGYPPSILGASVSWWEEMLTHTRPGAAYNAEIANWLQTVLHDTLTYVLTGIATDVIDLPKPLHVIERARVMAMVGRRREVPARLG